MPAAAQSGPVRRGPRRPGQAQAYLQDLTSAQGTFVETGAGGQRRTGRFYLQRPGKMRFEYTDPAGLLVVSDGYNVKRYDPRLNVFRQVPLGQTPLSTFLARNVRFDQGVRIDRVTRMAVGAFAITARDSRRPNDGSVILAFAGSPLRLQEWTITDAQGGAHPHPADHADPGLRPGRQPVPAARSDPSAGPQRRMTPLTDRGSRSHERVTLRI